MIPGIAHDLGSVTCLCSPLYLKLNVCTSSHCEHVVYGGKITNTVRHCLNTFWPDHVNYFKWQHRGCSFRKIRLYISYHLSTLVAWPHQTQNTKALLSKHQAPAQLLDRPQKTLDKNSHQLKKHQSVTCFPKWEETKPPPPLQGRYQHAKYVHPGSEDPAERSETLPPAPPPHSHSPAQPHFPEPECTQDTA